MIRAKIVGKVDLSAHLGPAKIIKSRDSKKYPHKGRRYIQKPLTRTFASILAPALREYRERASSAKNS